MSIVNGMSNRRPLLVAMLAALIVVLGTSVLHSAPFVFAAYHLVLCLLIPLLMSRHEGLDLAAHLRRLGVARRGLRAGLLWGLGTAFVPVIAFALWPDLFPDAARLREALSGWGLPARAPALFLFFLAAVNGPAEELFWRGWLLREPAPSGRDQILLAMLFTSYHAVTIGQLAPDLAAAFVLLGGVLAAALLWTWLRRRCGSVWPPLLAHTGATCGYLYVCARLLEMD